MLRAIGNAIEERPLLSLGSVLTAFFGISLVPIFVVESLPLADYAGHLARMHVLVNHEQSPFLQQAFEISWSPIPNLAMDAVVPLLAKIVSVEFATNLFIALTMLLTVIGTVLLHRVIHGRISLYPLVACLFLYNAILILGFINFLASLGLFTLAFALYIGSRDMKYIYRYAICVLSFTVLYFAHLFGFGLLAVCVASYEIHRILTARRSGQGYSPLEALVPIVAVAVPCLLLVLTSPTWKSGSVPWLGYLTDPQHYLDRLTQFESLVFNAPPEPAASFPRIVIIGLFALLIAGLATGRIVLARPMILPILALGLLLFVIPEALVGAKFVPDRFPIAIALLVVVATDWRVRHLSARMALGAALAALLVVQMDRVTTTWGRHDNTLAEYRAAISQLPQGARLTAVMTHDEPWAHGEKPALLHVPNYVTILRDGFYTTYFAYSQGQPVLLTPNYATIQDLYYESYFHPSQRTHEYMASERDPFDPRLLEFYDYMLVVGKNLPVSLPEDLEPIAHGSDFVLYEIGPIATDG